MKKLAIFLLVALSLSGFALAGRFQHPGIGLNREKGDYWMRPANWGGGRGRTSSEIDMAYLHYRWKRRLDFAKSEGSRYYGYAMAQRGYDYFHAFLWLPQEAAGGGIPERLDLEWLKVPR